LKERTKPTKDSLEAALNHFVGMSALTDEEKQEQVLWFQDAVNGSAYLGDCILGLSDCFRGSDAEAIQEFEKRLGRKIDPDIFLKHKIMTIAAQFFFVGWHTRGAVDEADQLKRMAE
jgi:hypothetical protein